MKSVSCQVGRKEKIMVGVKMADWGRIGPGVRAGDWGLVWVCGKGEQRGFPFITMIVAVFTCLYHTCKHHELASFKILSVLHLHF
jgi:hypothetical protein